jgi:hypothetical protein
MRSRRNSRHAVSGSSGHPVPTMNAAMTASADLKSKTRMAICRFSDIAGEAPGDFH